MEIFRRGYLGVEIDKGRAQAEWYHVKNITERTSDKELGRVITIANGETTLKTGTTASTTLTNLALLLP